MWALKSPAMTMYEGFVLGRTRSSSNSLKYQGLNNERLLAANIYFQKLYHDLNHTHFFSVKTIMLVYFLCRVPLCN